MISESVQALKEWQAAYEAAEENPQLLLTNYDLHSRVCTQRMMDYNRAEVNLRNIENPPDYLTRYLSAIDDAQNSTCCLFRSVGPIHERCGLVIKEFFASRQALLEAVKAI